ncbi:IS4 family transposase [Candidatus Accumulibacter sp. ACC003]|jgi:hypothetical protein|uniref:IS4 family transposase n=1 Tax=Candidatus Accumulibacter sp. ACC003 TaxID=2823334 RepID=UPI0025C36ADC|nr:IS4 family transposase [Candidatus Accumulibacter sp. ACC003]
MANWAGDEFGGAELGDGRLRRRLIKLATRFAEQPTASIPGACGDWAETVAAYRFFDQAHAGKRGLNWQSILQPHMDCSQRRMAQHPVVLCLQDTTELDFNGQEIEGLGPLSYEAQRGMYLHPTYAVTPEREPLGVIDAWMWAREAKAADGSRPGISESTRWIEGYERVAETAAGMPQTRLVYVADREADIVGLMQRAQALGTPADWLIRAKHNRCLPQGGKLWAATLAEAPLGEIEFTLASRHGQPKRIVRQQLRSHAVDLPARDTDGRHIRVTCLIATEIGAPAGCKPVEWRLLTNRKVADLEAAVELIDWYRCRWEIETLFHVLKNGCRVEALQLGSQSKLELALAVYLVVSWRLARLIRLGRIHPQWPADLLFSETEWAGAFILNKKKPPKKVPSIREVIRLIAQLGGFLARKGDGEPGVKSLWLGIQRLRDFVSGVEHMRELRHVM